MKILDVLASESILVDLQAQDKTGVIEELARPVAQIAGVDHEELVRVLLDRERLGSTGIGGGIGIPHGKLKDLDALALGFGISRKGLDFESMDGRPTRIFFLLVTPENSTGLLSLPAIHSCSTLHPYSQKEKIEMLLSAGFGPRPSVLVSR